MFVRPPELTGWQSMKQFLWNPKSNELLGRTAKSWAQIILFYIVLYAFLTGFFMALLMVFYQTLDPTTPTWTAESSRIGGSPGMGFRPMLSDSQSMEVKFSSDPKSYEKLLKSMKDFLKTYGPEAAQEAAKKGIIFKPKTCDYGSTVAKDEFCTFPVTDLHPGCTEENSFGFKEGKPCLFLKMNKIINWEPIPLTTEQINSTMSEDLKKSVLAIEDIRVREGNVWVSCEGEGKADVELMKNVTLTYGNNMGYPAYYYPFKNQPGYQAPFVTIQLGNLPKDKPVKMVCRLWAGNVVVDRQRRLGMTVVEVEMK